MLKSLPRLEIGIILKFTQTNSFYDENGLFAYSSSIITLLILN